MNILDKYAHEEFQGRHGKSEKANEDQRTEKYVLNF